MTYVRFNLEQWERDTCGLNDEEAGVYFRLLVGMYRTSTSEIEDNEIIVKRLSGATSWDVASIWEKLKPLFHVKRNGNYEQKAVRRELARQKKVSKSAHFAGKASALKRKGKSNARSTPVQRPLELSGSQKEYFA